MSEKNNKTLAEYRADARKARENKNKSVRDRLLKGKFSSTNKEEEFQSPAKIPYFSKEEKVPSEMLPHILTPPKLRKKDGVVGFNKDGCYYHVRNESSKSKTELFNPFDEFVHQNMGVLECFINKCGEHTRKCNGHLLFIGEDKSLGLRQFMGTLFGVYSMQCSLCNEVLQMETDLFQQRPNPQEKETCVSWGSQLTVLASKNMSSVFEEQKMLASMQGQKFFTFKLLQNWQKSNVLASLILHKKLWTAIWKKKREG